MDEKRKTGGKMIKQKLQEIVEDPDFTLASKVQKLGDSENQESIIQTMK